MRNDNMQALQPGAVVQLHRLCQGVLVQEDRLQTQVGFVDLQRFANMSTHGSVQVSHSDSQYILYVIILLLFGSFSNLISR